MNIQSGDRNLIVVNIHFEPDLTLRNLRERLRLITPHWPLCPEGLGVITEDFNICEPEEGRFNSWNQTEKAALFRSIFPHVLGIAQPDFRRRDSSADGTIRTWSRIDRAFINLPMAEARDFHCYSQKFENLGERSKKPTIRRNQVKRIRSGKSKRPVFCSILEQPNDDHQYPDDPCVALADFKVILEKA